MHASNIQVSKKTVSMQVYSGWGVGPHITFAGSTFPVVPNGTIIERLSMQVPDGLQAIAFSCRVEGPHQMGSGKTAHLDYDPKLSSSVMLIWDDKGKLIVKADNEMSAAELAQFNSFVRSDTEILVVNTEKKITYVSLPKFLPATNADRTWTYKLVSVDAVLGYITRKLTIEELDERAISEQRAWDELEGLRCEKRDFQNSIESLTTKVCELKREKGLLLERCDAAETQNNEFLAARRNMLDGLKRYPSWLRPKAVTEFITATELKKP